jgi:hypothetical protein
MKKIADYCVLGTLTLSLCLAGVANAAEAPAECIGGRNEMFFNLGVSKGVSLVNMAWASLGETLDERCRSDTLAEFIEIVITAFEAARPDPNSVAPQTVLCHWAGSYAGSVERASYLVNQCEGACCDEGQMIGEMATVFYCGMSIQLGGLGHDEWLVDVNITLCGDEFTRCCEEEFDRLTPIYPSEVDPQCLEFTQPPYSDPPDGVYEEARHNQCVYEVELPPAR